MIKTSTLDKKNTLKKEVKERANDIDMLVAKLMAVSIEADKMRKELKQIKQHWLYKIYNWLK